MEFYNGVRGRKKVEAICRAIEASGGVIIRKSDDNVAPFLFDVKTFDGQELSLVCYAFTANKYTQRGRPANEHRFQVKYGSSFDRSHSLYIDPDRKIITLMFGIHEQLDLFVGVDPEMHNPTWFSSSIEFKEENLLKSIQDGWHGWERERVIGGKRRVDIQEDLRTEIVLGFRPEYFLNFALFERTATEMDPGERLLFIDRVGECLKNNYSPAALLTELPEKESLNIGINHPLLDQLNLSVAELLSLIDDRFRLASAIRGGAAEFHLEKQLHSIDGISKIERLDKDGQPDFKFIYKDTEFSIECKNVLRRISGDHPRVDFQKTRASKSNPCSRYYEVGHFDILAACLHPVHGKWEFMFTSTNNLELHKECPKRFSPRVNVNNRSDSWSEDLKKILENIITLRS